MRFTEAAWSAVETPCMVIDVDQVRKNVLAMQAKADTCGCVLRPHIKTHKMLFFAQMQVDAGAVGITCAKVSEAEWMAEGGIRDIFIAYPMIGSFRIRRSIALMNKVDRLILAVDSADGASALNTEAKNADVCLEVRLEIDTGAKRTGIICEKAAELAKALQEMPYLRLTGIFTYKSLIYRSSVTEDRVLAGHEEGELMERVAQAIRALGIELTDISAGSTPTGEVVARTGKVTEIRPGTYIFNDAKLEKAGICQPDTIAAKYYATVVSCPDANSAVIDGGSKTFPMDTPIMCPPLYLPGYAVIEGREDLHLNRMNEEHGMIYSETGKTGLSVGQTICMIPLHVCTSVNMLNDVYLWDRGALRRQKVDARGMLV